MFVPRSCMVVVAAMCLSPGALAQTGGDSAWTTQPPSSLPTPDRQPVNVRPSFPSLTPRISHSDDGTARAEKVATHALSAPSVTVASSLAVVLGLFAGMIWLTRRFGGGASSNRALPKEALEVLGTATLQPRLTVSLVRVGSRVVVLGHSAQGVHTITEITDLDEANRLIATCRGESTVGFANELKAIEREPFRPGFVEPASDSEPRRRLFASA